MEILYAIFAVFGIIIGIVLAATFVYYIDAQVEMMKTTNELIKKMTECLDPFLDLYEKMMKEYND